MDAPGRFLAYPCADGIFTATGDDAKMSFGLVAASVNSLALRCGKVARLGCSDAVYLCPRSVLHRNPWFSEQRVQLSYKSKSSDRIRLCKHGPPSKWWTWTESSSCPRIFSTIHLRAGATLTRRRVLRAKNNNNKLHIFRYNYGRWGGNPGHIFWQISNLCPYNTCEEIANMYAPGFKFIKNTFPLTPPAAWLNYCPCAGCDRDHRG